MTGRTLSERKNDRLQVRCTNEEFKLWALACAPKTISQVVRESLNAQAGVPINVRPGKVIPIKQPKTHCSFSHLPYEDCLCRNCVRKRS